MKKEYILLGILVVILLTEGLWIFQIISEYQRVGQEYEELEENVKEVEEEEQDQQKQGEEESGKSAGQKHLPLILKHYSRSIRTSWRGFEYLAFETIRLFRERIIHIICTISSEKSITLPGVFFWMQEIQRIFPIVRTSFTAIT